MVIFAPTCSEGDGALTTIDVTVVGDGAVGPSLHAPRTAHRVTSATTFFMSTLLARETAELNDPA
jgi:hypothetical protein